MGNTYAGGNAALQALMNDGPLMLALYASEPGLDGSGTEISGAGYARQVITFATPATGATSNSAALQFPQALEDWGQVAAWAIFDASSVMRRFGLFAEAKAISIGDFVAIRVNNFSLSEFGDCACL